jgi:hypothetical protein
VLVEGRVFHTDSPRNFKECREFQDPPGSLSVPADGEETPFSLRTAFSLRESIGSSKWWPLLITKAKGVKLYGMVYTLSSTAHPRSQAPRATTGGLGGNKCPFYFVVLSRVPHFSLMQALLRVMAVRWLASTEEQQGSGEFEYLTPLVEDVDPLTFLLKPGMCEHVCVYMCVFAFVHTP